MPSYRSVLLLAAAAALSSTTTASNVPRNDHPARTPSPYAAGGDTRHGALEYYNNGVNPLPPKPTTAPVYPRFAAMGLADRELVLPNTCGYFVSTGVTGPYFDWFVCANSQAVCTTSGTIRQCCHTDECSTTTFGTTCLDYTACDSTRDPNTYCCTYTNAQPYCTSFLWSTLGGDTFTFFGCGEEDTSRVQIMYATTEGVNIGASTSQRSSTSSNDDSESSTVRSDTTGPSPRPSSGNSNDTDGDGSNDGGSSAPVGAIVGGVVGGIAVISLIALGVFFVVRKAHNTNANANNPAAQPFMAQNNMPPPGPDPAPHQGPQQFGSVGYAPSVAPTHQTPPPFGYAQSTAPTAPTPYSVYSNPHQSVYGPVSAMGPMSPHGNSPHSTQAWTAPPPGSPPPHWQQGQAPPQHQWETKETGQSQQNVQELGSDNPIGQYGGNNRAELG
jgi:hypothetical protein